MKRARVVAEANLEMAIQILMGSLVGNVHNLIRPSICGAGSNPSESRRMAAAAELEIADRSMTRQSEPGQMLVEQISLLTKVN